MTTIQEAKLKMFDAVISFCNQHYDIIAATPALEIVYVKFTDSVSAIRVMASQKALDIKGVAVNKKQLRAVLIKKASGIAGVMIAYSRSTNNIELRGQVNYKPTDFKLLRDEELLAVCQNIANFANASLPALAPYNITADTIADFYVAIDQFRAALPRPRNAINQRGEYGESLERLIDYSVSILKDEMDNIILNLQTTNANFHSLYTSNRIIVDFPTTSTQIKGVITYNKLPIEGALITVIETGATAITDATGTYTLKPLQFGKYTITITKEGFETITLTTVVVKRGKIKKVNAALVKRVQEK